MMLTLRSASPRMRHGLGLASFLVLAGCGPSADETQAPIGANTAGPSALPANSTATTPGIDPPAAAATMLTPEGFGPLRIGMTLAEVNAALGPDSDPEAVGGPEPESCDQFRPERAPEGLLVMIEEGRLTSITLHDQAAVATDRGLRLGATAAEVRAAYGSALRSEPHEYQDPPAEYLTFWALGRIGANGVAEPDSRGIRYEIGGDGRVDSIHAGGPSIQYVEGCA